MHIEQDAEVGKALGKNRKQQEYVMSVRDACSADVTLRWRGGSGRIRRGCVTVSSVHYAPLLRNVETMCLIDRIHSLVCDIGHILAVISD